MGNKAERTRDRRRGFVDVSREPVESHIPDISREDFRPDKRKIFRAGLGQSPDILIPPPLGFSGGVGFLPLGSSGFAGMPPLGRPGIFGPFRPRLSIPQPQVVIMMCGLEIVPEADGQLAGIPVIRIRPLFVLGLKV
jgi:hypothetical protein